MESPGFLEDGFKDLKQQREALKQEALDKKKAGYVKVRVLDPMDGNKMKNMWIKKDEATIAWEEEQAKKKEFALRQRNILNKKKMLENLKLEKEIEEQEKELEEMEKKLLKDGLAKIENKVNEKDLKSDGPKFIK